MTLDFYLKKNLEVIEVNLSLANLPQCSFLPSLISPFAHSPVSASNYDETRQSWSKTSVCKKEINKWINEPLSQELNWFDILWETKQFLLDFEETKLECVLPDSWLVPSR